MDKKSTIMKPEKKEARPKQKMMEQKIKDVLANDKGQEGKEDVTEAKMEVVLWKNDRRNLAKENFGRQ